MLQLSIAFEKAHLDPELFCTSWRHVNPRQLKYSGPQSLLVLTG